MPHATFLPQTVLIFGAAVVVARLFGVLRAPAIIGFLFTGLIIGPSGFRLIPHDDVALLAEFGLVLLLFTVGLELSAEPIIRSGRRLIVAGGLQIASTALVTAIVLVVMRPISFAQSATIGIAVALSSTAIVLKQLGDMRQMDSPAGTVIVGILLLQDVAVVLVMLLMPIWSGHESVFSGKAIWHGLLAIGGLAGVTILARTALPKILRSIAGATGREMHTLLAVLMACSGAYLASLAGWSWALGACIAGMLLAETDLRHQLFADILPFRDVFNALFFISMGMLVDLPANAGHLGLILGVVLGIILVKSALAGAAISIAGWPLRIGFQAGIGLCTVSEFAYVLIREGQRTELLGENIFQFMMAVIVCTMMIGAMLVPISDRLAVALLAKSSGPCRTADESGPAGHVIVVGFGLNGRNLARVLLATGIDFRVIEMNRALAKQARESDFKVVLGDAAQTAILEHAGLAGARALVIAIDDQRATRRIVAQARAVRSDLFVLARTRYVTEVDVLHSLGASRVIPEEFETSIEIFSHLLKELRIPNNVVEAQIAMVRAGRYGMLRGIGASASRNQELMDFFAATATQTYLLSKESTACGKTMRELDLRARTGVTVIALVRAGKPIANPTADTRLEGHDVLVLLGSHQQLDQAKTIFDAPGQ